MCPAATSPRSATIAISGRNRIAELDGVRGVAIGLVLIWHYFANGIVAPVEGTWLAHLKSMLGLTWSGVDLFFVLSGFLIGGILLDAKDSPNFFRTFYARRAFRILPLYFILIVLFIEGWLLNRSGIATPLRIFNAYIPVWTYPLFVQNFAMVWRGSFGAAWLALTWSLAIEEQFYLLLPLVIRRVSVNLVPTLAVSAICFAPLFRVALWLSGAGYFGLYILLPSRADALGFGVLVAFIYRDQKSWRWVQEHERILLAALISTGFGLVFFLVYDGYLYIVGLTVISLFYALLLMSAIRCAGRRSTGFLRSRGLTGLGTIAYAVYLFHQGINMLMHAAILRTTPRTDTAPSLIVTLCSLAIVILLSSASWRWIESPFIRLAHSRFRY